MIEASISLGQLVVVDVDGQQATSVQLQSKHIMLSRHDQVTIMYFTLATSLSFDLMSTVC